MVYESNDHVVDFLPEKVINDLRNYDTVAISLSGGSDSALILFMLCEEISKGTIDVSIQPKCVQDMPNLHLASQSIIEQYRKMYPSVVIKDLVYLPEVNSEKLSDSKRNYYFLKLDTMYKLQNTFTFVGTTSQPPLSVLTTSRYGFDRILKDRPVVGDDGDYSYEPYNYQPFIHVDKRFVADMYRKYNLMETIYPLTKSCTNSDKILTENFTKPCKKCWWCAEKKWAFGLYDGEKE